jgi:hypothetical protein
MGGWVGGWVDRSIDRSIDAPTNRRTDRPIGLGTARIGAGWHVDPHGSALQHLFRALRFGASQAGVAILVICVASLTQFVFSPFWDKRVNILDCSCCLGVYPRSATSLKSTLSKRCTTNVSL